MLSIPACLRTTITVSCMRNIWSVANSIQDLGYCPGAADSEQRRRNRAKCGLLPNRLASLSLRVHTVTAVRQQLGRA